MKTYNFFSIKAIFFDAINFAVVGSILTVAILHPTEEQLLSLHRNALVFLIFFIVGSGLSSILISCCYGKKQSEIKKIISSRYKTLGAHLFESPKYKLNHSTHSFFSTVWGWQLLLTLVLVFITGAIQTHFSFGELFDPQGLNSASQLFRQIASPDWSILPIAVLKVIETIFIAFMATVLAIPIAFFLAFLSAKNIMKHPLAFAFYGLMRTFLNIIRSIEPIIWAIIFSVWVGIGSFSGMLALMIHSVASLTKQYSEIVESVNEGPIEGIQSTGANLIQTIWFAIVPQVVLPYISFTIYRWDINVRMATIIGFAGGGGIGTLLNQYSMRAMWPQVGCLIVVIAAVVWFMDMASAYLRESLK
ncbi:MAG: phosphonate ABC transporter, permease protein PhnE [Bdellovibrionales bacterium]|nr:phosphonate ABC transporter, permease protein PhnE [Bdellovibrionales bacterium]